MKRPVGRPLKENLLAGLTNLDTGEAAPPHTCSYFPSMKAAAHALKVDIQILRDARAKDCAAFRTGGSIHRQALIDWIKDNANKYAPAGQGEDALDENDEFSEDYSVPDEAGGVGQTLKSLQMEERRLKFKLDKTEASTKMHPRTKAEEVKELRSAWLSVSKTLLQYDLKVSMAKRESGELLPMVEAVAGVHALLAWHTVATSDALRNVIPELEGKTKFQIATLLDPAMRSAIYRNFKLGVKIGKIPEWMGKTASEFVKAEKPFSLDKPAPSTNLEDY